MGFRRGGERSRRRTTPFGDKTLSTVVKAEEVQRQGLQLRVFSLADIQAQADEILTRARAEAASVLADAQRRRQELIKQAKQQGHAEGYQEGLTEGRHVGHEQGLTEARQRFGRDQEQLLAALTALLDDFDQQKRRMLSQTHSDLVRLALAIAARVVKRVVDTEPEVAASNVQEAVALVSSSSDVVIHVHPAELESLQRFCQQWAEQTGRLDHLRVVADESIDRGGCAIRTGSGQVDATVQGQLTRIAEQLVPGGQRGPVA